MRRNRLVLLFPARARLAVVPMVLVVAVGCSSTGDRPSGADTTASAQASPAAEPLVVVVPVESRVFERTLSLPADLAAFQDVAIHARVQGFIESIAVDRGSVVRRGTALAGIVAPELTAQLAAAEAETLTAASALAEAQATLAAERSTYDRLTQASKTPGVVAGNDLEVARQRVEAARARVAASNDTVEARRQSARSLREVESYLRVTAPFDGVVTERSAHVGSLVGPATDPIVRMQQVNPLRLVVPIPEGQLGAATAGQPVEFTVAAFPDETFTGRLARVARALDPGTRTMAVEIDVDNAAGRLAPGMYADVRWPVRREGASLFVPRSAVATTTERIFVVRLKDGVTEWVDVKRGVPMGDHIEVIGNLAPGDQVALRGTDELRPGTPVRPSPQTKG